MQPQLDRARYIRTILAHHDHSQNDLGKLLGITQQAAGRKLRGMRRFEVDELVLIADTYGISVEHLIRPPELTSVLGAVRTSGPDLLTCTKYQFPLVAAGVVPAYGISANPALFERFAAA